MKLTIRIPVFLFSLLLGLAPVKSGLCLDLLQQYPTKLEEGDASGDRARPWQFSGKDIYEVSRFELDIGKSLKVEMGPADVGIGHCGDGAVWAVVLPRQGGRLQSSSLAGDEAIAHVWLRFHPAEIRSLFPPETVTTGGATNLENEIRRIARHKFFGSWHAGENALIPGRNDLTVDIDSTNQVRRFFMVDTRAETAQYARSFEKRYLTQPPPMDHEEAARAFDQIWQSFENKYAMFILRPEVDWGKLREQYRPQAIASASAYDFAATCAQMLAQLRDLHVWLTLAGSEIPVFNRPRASNANGNPAATRKIVGSLTNSGSVQWSVTGDKVGYIGIPAWNGPQVPAGCNQALEQMRDTRGLIIDVRQNGGGSEDEAAKFAARFLKTEFIYAYSRFRNGPKHTDLTEKIARRLSPAGPWRYDRPVTVLIGEKCMSSNESFVGMMTGDPDAVTMGDHTCGSSGNPQMVNLPLDMTVSVPRWIDYLPDGTPLDERGFQPQVVFKPAAGAFEGTRDDLLAAALEQMRQKPLPEKPIEGPAYLSDEQAETGDPSRPKVVSVIPANDTESVQPATELRIQFDRPMDPYSLKLNWKSGGFVSCEFPKYDPEKHQFIISVRLLEGADHEIIVNQPLLAQTPAESRKTFPRDGFQSTDHHLASMFQWHFRAAVSKPAPNAAPPRVIKISPPQGESVPFRTFLEVQFDQAMKSPHETLLSLVAMPGLGQPALVPAAHYDAGSRTFHLPLLLTPKSEARFSLEGFCSEAGAAAEALKLRYSVSDTALSRGDEEKLEEARHDSRLLKLLESMREKRAGLGSITERVQTLSMLQNGPRFDSLTLQSAAFKWERAGRFYADATDMMLSCNVFVIGNDGENCWWQSDSSRGAKLVTCRSDDIAQKNLSICDPFNLSSTAPAEVISKRNLAFAGFERVANADCQVVEEWDVSSSSPELVSSGQLQQWWIDGQTGRLVEVRNLSGNYLSRTRFIYESINEPIAPESFREPKTLTASPPEALDSDYNRRFINVMDGSDGRVSVRWGKRGPKGTSSSGLN